MGFKKHNWVKYGRTGTKCEIQIVDDDGKKLDFFKFPIKDKKAKDNIVHILKRAYGINLSKKETESGEDIKEIMKKDLGII